MIDWATTTTASRAERVAHGLEGRVLGQVLADVVGEDLVDDDRGHDHGDEDAEGEELAGRGLVHPVVDLSRQDLLAREWLVRPGGAASLSRSSVVDLGLRADLEEREVRAARRG